VKVRRLREADRLEQRAPRPGGVDQQVELEHTAAAAAAGGRGGAAGGRDAQLLQPVEAAACRAELDARAEQQRDLEQRVLQLARGHCRHDGGARRSACARAGQAAAAIGRRACSTAAGSDRA